MDNKSLVEGYIKKVTQDSKVINAFLSVDRKDFIPDELKDRAYMDTALPIGYDQTISQPSLVAEMTALLNLTGDKKVLEIGTGSGYQAAILSHLVKEVITLEIVEQLHKRAKKLFAELDLKNIQAIHANGSIGYEDQAPYDAIIVTAGAEKIPTALLEQLKDGGKIVIPQGKRPTDLVLKLGIRKGDKFEFQDVTNVQFVPLTGKEGWND